MKHGVAFRKFSRTSSHRMLMLRNLVTSLFKHEQIKTTLPKARDTARLAEKIITMGKKGDLAAYKRASAFLLEPKVTPKVFEEFAERYKDRVGGYTRIHKYGNRPGDNAPHAVLELVDNPHDIKFDMTARAVGWEMLSKRIEHATPEELRAAGPSGVKDVLDEERQRHPDERGQLRSTTRWNLQKVLRFRSKDAVEQLQQKAEDHMDTLLAQPVALKQLAQQRADKEAEAEGLRVARLKAGQTLPGGNCSTLSMVQGALGKKLTGPAWYTRRKLGIDRASAWE
ncbi:mitochondrial ribosomal protein L17 [Irpex rosettiformis]|uniref:Mitochondrial ribosomal protein L17 n=1 Tax=Irpex rosettiformis TaxID=378272 RepID=A0ACB8UKF4_9APHY|nr:mitochondrial ribosomal protein L17 [Irpex rosettiformis]